MLLLPFGLLGPPASYLAPLLLDTLAATVKGAYGMRQLRTAYAGPCLRVRRGSDNAEADIGFSNKLLDTVTLLAFCGAGSGFVRTWYDQSVNAQHAAQATAAQQPQIVASGALVTLPNAAGRPTLAFSSASTQWLFNAGFALGGAAFASASVVARGANMLDANPRMLGYAAPNMQDFQTGSAIFAFYSGGILKGYKDAVLSQASLGTAPVQVASVFTGAAHTLTLDGTASASSAESGALAATGTLGIGLGNIDESWDGWQAEHLVVAGALSTADQAAIRASQVAFYGTP